MFATVLKGLDDLQRAVSCTAFLVTGNQQRDAAVIVWLRLQEALNSDQHGCKTTLHIG